MRKYLLSILILMLASAAVLVYAQGEDEGSTLEREIYTVLAFGEDVFEPELWYTSAAESAGRTTATWSARPESGFYGAIAYADYLHFDNGYSTDGLALLFDDSWFDGVLANYDGYSNSTACETDDGLMLFEFAVNSDGAAYTMRYWVEEVTETRVMAMFIVFPARDVTARQLLEAYSGVLYPDLPICPR